MSNLAAIMKGLPNKCDNVKSRWVIGVAEELHQSVDDARSNFRKLDCGDMNKLDEKLPIL